MKPHGSRYVAIAVAALLLLIAAAAAVLVWTFDAERHKALVIDWVKSERQRTLAIGGPIRLSVFPRLEVEVSRLRLSERGRADEFLAADEAALAVQVLPLLRGRLVIDRIAARGVRVTYSRDADGRRNVDDLVAADRAGSAASGAALRFDVGAVRIDDLRLRLRDEALHVAGEVALQSLSAGRLAPRVETPVSLRATVELTQPRAVKFALHGSMSVALDLDRGAVAVTGLKLAIASHEGANPLELSLDWPKLAVDTQSLTGGALSGRFRLAGPTALAGSFRSEAPSGSLDALRLPGVAVRLQGSAGQRQFEGSATADLLLGVARGVAAFERIDVRATLANPGVQALQVTVGGNASADGKSAQWALRGQLNADRFESTGRASFAGSTPRIQADARFDRLDLNRLLAPGKTAPAEPAPAAAAAPADTPRPLEGLNAVDGRFRFTAGALAFRQYQLADVAVSATLDDGALRVERLTCRAWGGSVEASASAEARSRRIALELLASDVDVDALLTDVAGRSLIEGSGRIQAALASSGASAGALRSNLAGSVALRLRNGAIKGVDLARVMRQAQAAWSRREDSSSKARATEKTAFYELSASARIAGGIAHSDDLDLQAPFLRIGGAGRFDIGRGTVDYTARATVVAPPAGESDAGLLAALRGVTVPVVLSGPFDAIDWKVQWSSAAAASVESRIRERILKELGTRPSSAPAPGAAGSSTAAPKDKLLQQFRGLFK